MSAAERSAFEHSLDEKLIAEPAFSLLCLKINARNNPNRRARLYGVDPESGQLASMLFTSQGVAHMVFAFAYAFRLVG